jgi:hypothetical protein
MILLRALVCVPFAAAACASSVVVDTDRAMVAWGADRACKSDDDCAMIDDCCACTAGGGRLGINARARAAVDARRKEPCSTDDSVASPDATGVTPVTCTNVPKSDGSCASNARAVCRDRMCRIAR